MSEIEVELVSTDVAYDRASLERLRSEHARRQTLQQEFRDNMDRRMQFRVMLCQLYRAATLGHETIQAISDAPLTAWLMTGRWHYGKAVVTL